MKQKDFFTNFIRKWLITVFKSFTRPHLVYGATICNQACNAFFTGYSNRFNIMVHQLRRAYEELQMKSSIRSYAFNLCNRDVGTEHFVIFIKYLRSNRGYLSIMYISKVFFPATIKEWNMPDSDIWRSESLNVFQNNFIRPKAKILNCLNPKEVKLTIRLQLGLSHLRDHKFKHSFQDCLSPICSCLSLTALTLKK